MMPGQPKTGPSITAFGKWGGGAAGGRRRGGAVGVVRGLYGRTAWQGERMVHWHWRLYVPTSGVASTHHACCIRRALPLLLPARAGVVLLLCCVLLC